MTSSPLVKLGDCCTVVGGSTPKRGVPEYWGDDIPWVTPKDISKLRETVLEDAPEYISREGYKSCATQLVPKGTVLLTSRAPIGNVAIAGREMCTNQGFKSLVPSADVDSLYLFHCMKYMAPRLQAAGNGATFKEVSKAIVEKFQIPLPPLEEQKRIAATLDKAGAIRHKRQQAIELTDQLLRSVFLDMFGEPVTNTKGWEVFPLIELIQPDRPITYGILKPGPDLGGGVPYVRVVDMKDGTVNVAGIRRTSVKIDAQYKRSRLEEGDLLLSIRGHVGRLSVTPPSLAGGNITQDTARLAPGEKILSSYLFHHLASDGIQRWMGRHTKGGTVKGINLGDVKKIPVALPPLAEQECFDRMARKVLTLKRNQKESASEILVAATALAQKAFAH